MRKSKKFLLTALAAGMLLVPGMMVSAQEETVVPEPEMPVVNDMSKYLDVETDVFYGNWVAQDGKWWFKGEDGFYPANDIYEIDGVSYGFDESGWMVTGWRYYAKYESWFYFYGDGSLAKGWVYDGSAWYYTSPKSGIMYYDGIYTISGQNYYLYPSGVMAANGWARINYSDSTYFSWCYAAADGALQKGWLWLDGSWYYLNEVGYMARGNYPIDNTRWIFDASGRLSTGGWTNYEYDYIYTNGSRFSGNDWYYANADGTGYNGWLWENGSWYYISQGSMVNGRAYLDPATSKAYFFLESGIMATTPGWHARVYDPRTGEEIVEWYYIKDTSGELYAGGTWEINGKKYSFAENGLCLNP